MSRSASGSVGQSSTTQSSQSCNQPQNVQSIRQKTDPAWNHCKLTIEEGGKKVLLCVHCAEEFRGGGINRIKQYLAGNNGDALSCKKVDEDTRYIMEENLKEIAAKKKKSVDTWDDEHPFGPNVMEFDRDDIHEIPPPQVAEARVNTTIPPASQRAKKRTIETTEIMSRSASGSVGQSSTTQSSQSCNQPQNVQSIRQKTDPAWNHCKLTIEEGGKKVYICVHCAEEFRGGGINRIKQYLAGNNGDALSCKKVDEDTRYIMEENLKEIAAKKKKSVDTWDDEHPFGPNVMEFDRDDIHEIPPPQVAEARVNTTIPPASQRAKKRTIETTGNYFATKIAPRAQPTIISVFAVKEAVHKVDLVIVTLQLAKEIGVYLKKYTQKRGID
ncbi:hypothetical protein KIW84_055658 [Lathyrus oleraceus]|uniref:BED-type domain-containing protein n=1 Tax=Pisum sativum TaxID=3888 RepID=A0A9D4WXC0_PEA|nr:hypothetical protein KIW84_055658 [Pisum sativum]